MGTKPMRGGGSRAQRLRAHQLRELVKRLVPGGVLLDHRPLAPDVATSSRTAKAKGYGEPLRLHVRDAEGNEQRVPVADLRKWVLAA